MHTCKSWPTTPLVIEKLLAHVGYPLSDEGSTRYMSTVGIFSFKLSPYLILHLLLINYIATFMHQLSIIGLVVKRILSYIKGTIDFGLRFRKSSSFHISSFLDVDCAGHYDDRRSIGRFTIHLGSNVMSWSARKEATMERSRTRAEYKLLNYKCHIKISWVNHYFKNWKFHSQEYHAYGVIIWERHISQQIRRFMLELKIYNLFSTL